MENTERYKTITASEFLKRLQVNNDEIIIEDIIVNENIQINIRNLRNKVITFKSGEFGNVIIFGYDKEVIDIRTLLSDGLGDLIEFKIIGGDFYKFSIQTKNIGKFEIEEGFFRNFSIKGNINGFYISGGEFRNFIIESGNFNGFEIKNKKTKFDFNHNLFKIKANECYLKSELNKLEIDKKKFSPFFHLLSIVSGNFKMRFDIIGGVFTMLNIFDGIFNEVRIKAGRFTAFTIKNGAFNEKFTVSGGVFRRFCIENGLFNEVFKISQGEFRDFSIENANFKKLFQIGQLIKNKNILTFDLPARIIGGDFNSICIESGEFKQGISLGDTKIEKDCIFQAGVFTDITINNGFYNSVHFTNPTITGKVYFRKVLNAKFISFERLDFGISEISELLFENCAVPTGTLIKINETHIENISFINSVNFGNIVFSGVKGTKISQQSTLKINNSDLGKTTFIDCNFEEMELDFKSSKITEVFLAGTKMPLKIKEEHNDKKEQTNLDQQRLGYGQLKKIYENRGDTVSANDYFAKEMNVVYIQTAWQSFGEKVMLFLNKCSSNHGTNWLKALGVTMIVAIVLFILYAFSIGLSCGNWSNKTDTALFCDYASNLLEFINPIHKADFIIEDMNKIDKISKLPKQSLRASNWSKIIDGFARIFITYLIYQLIQAFRKHKKSST